MVIIKTTVNFYIKNDFTFQYLAWEKEGTGRKNHPQQFIQVGLQVKVVFIFLYLVGRVSPTVWGLGPVKDQLFLPLTIPFHDSWKNPTHSRLLNKGSQLFPT
jgi:hypothetical protein